MNSKPLPIERLTSSEELFVVSMHLLYGALALVTFGAFVWLPWVVGITFAVLLLRESAKRKQTPMQMSKVHGDAHFGTEQEVVAHGFAGNKGLILGKLEARTGALPVSGSVLSGIVSSRMRDVAKVRPLIERYVNGGIRKGTSGRIVRLPATDKFSNVAVYMPPGFGKTFGHLIPNLFDDSGENSVIYDPSGIVHRETAAYRRKVLGHETALFDPFGQCGVPNCDSLNVLDLIDAESPAAFDFARNLARAMVPEKQGNSQEPFWHSATVSASEFLIYLTMRTATGDMRNIRTLGELLSAERFHELAEMYSSHPDEVLRRKAMQMASFDGRTLQSLIGCLVSEHGWLDAPAFSQSLSKSSLDVRDLFRSKRQTLYIVIPAHRTLESQPFVRMLLTAILFAAFEAGPDIKRRPVRFFLDEISTLGRLDGLMTLYSQGRKYGLKSANYFQSLGQVAEIMGTPERVHTFRSNMAAEIIKANDFQSADEASKWIGQKTDRTTSYSGQDGTNAGWNTSSGGNQVSRGQSGGTNTSSGFNHSELGVPLIRPEQILQMGEKEALVLVAGAPPMKINIIQATEAASCGKLAKGGDKSYLRSVRRWALFNLCAAVALVLIAAGLIVGRSKF